MKIFIILGSLIFAQFSFAQVLTGEEAMTVREALVGHLENKTVICKKEFGSDTVIGTADIIRTVEHRGYEISISQQGQPAIAIKILDATRDYTMSFSTTEDLPTVTLITIKSYTVTNSRVNVGTLVKPEFKNERVKKPYYLGTCEVI